MQRILIALVLAVSLRAAAEPARTYAFTHGRWFDGTRFVTETVYAVDGALTRRRPPRIDRTLDLGGGFVIPPFADAHTHHFDGAATREQVAMYLRDGVFYAKVQTDVRSGALRVAGEVNRPDRVDVSYAHGALTSSHGHGVEIYEGMALGIYRFFAMSAEEIARVRASHLRENDAYYVIDTAADLAAKWPMIAAGRPDFLKLYLLTSEEHAARVARTDTVGDRGVDPALVPDIVARGHAAGLRVSAHVDTVTDYRVALAGGVDEMAHLPGYFFDAADRDERYLLSDADAAETARRGVWVIVAPVHSQAPPALQRRIDAVRAANLARLVRAGVHLAFGSDWYGSTPVPAVRYLARTGVLGRRALLRIWCEDTPRTIFPGRKLGRLADGYEASFLVLAGNPLDDFDAVTRIRLRFKQGQLLAK